MRKLIINEGDVFGRLTVLNEEPKRMKLSGKLVRRFKLKCNCGNYLITDLRYLSDGRTTSCGCYNKEKLIEASIKLGETTKNGKRSYTPEYQSWRCMRDRCLYPGNNRWQHYGGRGITICERWLNVKDGYKNFLEDMGRKPDPSYSIDRIDVDGNYEPDNCRWADNKTQMKNRRCMKQNG
jgi:hypothetical protein